MVESNEMDLGDDLPPMDIGAAFYAKYSALEILGRGVSSTVRRCVEKDTGKNYAAKIVDVSQDYVDADGLTIREQIMREVDILRQVAGHEYIVELMDVFECQTYIFLIFELAVNGELFEYLNSVIMLSEKKATRIFRQILEALKHCHNRGVIHRDIKPENILLDENFNIKLTDFGFAKVLQPEERLFDVCGTPGYLAPEVLRAGMSERRETHGYGLEADIWSAGVVLYTMLVGFPPFWHKKQLMMIRRIMEGKYNFDAHEWKEKSQLSKDLISKMLVVDYKHRLTVNQCLSHEFISPQSSPRKESRLRSMSSISSMSEVLLSQHIDPVPVEEIVQESVKTRTFNPKRAWRVVLLVVKFTVRLKRQAYQGPVTYAFAKQNPYQVKILRRIIDKEVFNIYGHWIKSGEEEGQSRAIMFEAKPKMRRRHASSNNDQNTLSDISFSCGGQ